MMGGLGGDVNPPPTRDGGGGGSGTDGDRDYLERTKQKNPNPPPAMIDKNTALYCLINFLYLSCVAYVGSPTPPPQPGNFMDVYI